MILNIAIIALGVILDQVTKMMAAAHLTDIGTYPIIEGVFHFTYVENRGAAFGMLADHRWIFMILSVIGILAMFIWQSINRRDIMWNRVALSFIIGGGIGNMIDRVALGYVIDFIDCRFIDFYVFNVADSFVCVGCAMYVIGILWQEINEKKKAKAGSAVSDASAGDEVAENE